MLKRLIVNTARNKELAVPTLERLANLMPNPKLLFLLIKKLTLSFWVFSRVTRFDNLSPQAGKKR